MGSRGRYAGQPLTFYCAKCRRSLAFRGLNGVPGQCGFRWRTTGRVRKLDRPGMNHHHWGNHRFQYECLDCGHKGWSAHPDVATRHTSEFGKEIHDHG